MKNPDHDARRTIIREWMRLPKDKRSSKEQAQSFAIQAAKRHALKGPGDAAVRIVGWLLPRVAKNQSAGRPTPCQEERRMTTHRFKQGELAGLRQKHPTNAPRGPRVVS